ncbi:MAG: aminotransferase class I/II-fold pyridoxal phosphate-dependent enzyme [Gammaproteobacteria bacterium]|nr:aminotransferase class I/II-fold pyridoxal phosphate-dependent enzyme [Gammaproteobacteria bacterium]
MRSRVDSIRSFRVMDVLERALAREAAGHSVIHLEIGEPDFATPDEVIAAGISALRADHTRYVQALGIPALREAIAASYAPADLDPERVAVAPGSSGALQLVMGLLLREGDEVLLADPGYPCNANFVRLYGGVPRLLPSGPDSGYQLTAQRVADAWGPKTRVVMVATPANPTGALIAPEELEAIADTVAARGGYLIVDEIYQGLVYDRAPLSMLASRDEVFVVNSFSKYHGMTGWRIGWLVMPHQYREAITRLAQNLFISTSTPAQFAALRALGPDLRVEFERRRKVFHQRRDFLVPALRGLGFGVPLLPAGAFYVYADVSGLGYTGEQLAHELLEEADVAITPGADFGSYRAAEHVRFSYAASLEALSEAVARMGRFFAGPAH